MLAETAIQSPSLRRCLHCPDSLLFGYNIHNMYKNHLPEFLNEIFETSVSKKPSKNQTHKIPYHSSSVFQKEKQNVLFFFGLGFGVFFVCVA